jgi:hypothetical protein
VLACEHGVTALLDAGGAAKVEKEVDRLVGQEVLGEVKVQVGGIKAELGHTVGIGSEPILQADALCLERIEVVLKGLLFGGCGDVNGGNDICHGGLLVLGLERT